MRNNFCQQKSNLWPSAHRQTLYHRAAGYSWKLSLCYWLSSILNIFSKTACAYIICLLTFIFIFYSFDPCGKAYVHTNHVCFLFKWDPTFLTSYLELFVILKCVLLYFSIFSIDLRISQTFLEEAKCSLEQFVIRHHSALYQLNNLTTITPEVLRVSQENVIFSV